MLKTGKVICPTCGSEIVEFDTLDIDVDNTTVTLFKVGECNHCGNHYQWHEEYTLAGYRNLKQTNDDEPDDIDDDCGFDPYLGFYANDC